MFGTKDKGDGSTEQQKSTGDDNTKPESTPNFVTNTCSKFWMLVCILWETLIKSVSQIIYFVAAVEALKLVRRHLMLALGIFVAMFCLYLMGYLLYSVFAVD